MCRPLCCQGHPIFVEKLGAINAKKIEELGLADTQLIAYHLREMEFMIQCVFNEASQREGHTVDQVVTIMDASGLKFGSLTGYVQKVGCNSRCDGEVGSSSWTFCIRQHLAVECSSSSGSCTSCMSSTVAKTACQHTGALYWLVGMICPMVVGMIRAVWHVYLLANP